MPSLSEFQVDGPEWAKGCEACTYGMVVAPPIIGSLPLYEQRAIAHGEDMILYCDCRAGHMARQHLRKLYAALPLESLKNLREHFLSSLPVPSIHPAGASETERAA